MVASLTMKFEGSSKRRRSLGTSSPAASAALDRHPPDRLEYGDEIMLGVKPRPVRMRRAFVSALFTSS